MLLLCFLYENLFQYMTIAATYKIAEYLTKARSLSEPVRILVLSLDLPLALAMLGRLLRSSPLPVPEQH